MQTPAFVKPPEDLNRKHRFGLRRRIFAIVLILALGPSLLTMFIAMGFAFRTIKAYAIEQAENRLSSVAERIGDQLQAEAVLIRSVAEDPVVIASVEQLVDSGSVTSWPGPVLPGGSRRYLVVRFGQVVGVADGARLRPQRSLDLTPLERQLVAASRATPGSEGVLLVPTDNPAEFWAMCPLPSPGGAWLATAVRPSELASLLDRPDFDRDERIIVVSSRDGILGGRDGLPEAEEVVAATPNLFSLARGLFRVGDRDDVVYTSVRLGALANLTRPSGGELSYVLLRRVDLGAPTSALLYRFWQLALLGVVFLAWIAALGVWLSKRLVDPIMKLRAGFLRLEQGDLDYRIAMATGDELEELGSSMNQMAGTLQRTYENLANKLLELDEKARQLSITYEIGQTINRSLEMDTLFRDLIASVRQLVPAERVMLGLLSEDRSRFEHAYTWPEGGWRFQNESPMMIAGSHAEKALADGGVHIVALSPEGILPEEFLLSASGARTACLAPLVGISGKVGVLLLADRDPRAFRQQEADLLERLAPSLATAVEHSRLYARQAEFANELERKVAERTQELQRAQEQLVQVEKLAASGELAANVAHEINNPLSIIKNYMKLLESQLIGRRFNTENSELVREGLTIIGEEIDRIARIVEQLRKVNSPASAEVSSVELNRELEMLMQLFRQTFHKKRLEIEVRFDPAIGAVVTCSDYVRQILINLLRNSYDATDVGGRLTVETQAFSPDDRHFRIIVRDTGIGIPPENLKKIFDPFFTTKKEGKGTGLGLSVSYGLARQMGGWIEAVSPTGGGTEMRVTLPYHCPGSEEHADVSVVRRQGGKIIIG